MYVNPYQSPRPLPEEVCVRTLQDGRWSLALTGVIVGGYVGAWVGSLSGAGVGVMFALAAAGGQTFGLQDPAVAFLETLISTGLLAAILGTLVGAALGATLGVLLAWLVAVSSEGLRRAFVWLSCTLACLAAAALALAMFRFDPTSQEWRPLAVSHGELVARVAAIGFVGLGGLVGGGLLGRILHEVAWEPGAPIEVVGDPPRDRMGEKAKA